MWLPSPLATNTGSTPTERHARTGELTPPGMTCFARSKICAERDMRCTLAEPRPRPIFDADIGADGDTDADTDFGEFKRTRRCSCSIDVARPGARSRWAHHGFRRVRHVDLAALHARPAARSTSRHRSEARGSSAAGGRERNIAEANQRV